MHDYDGRARLSGDVSMTRLTRLKTANRRYTTTTDAQMDHDGGEDVRPRRTRIRTATAVAHIHDHDDRAGARPRRLRKCTISADAQVHDHNEGSDIRSR